MKHYDEIQEDASDGLWALLGKAAHSVIESAGKSSSEIKLEVEFEGSTIVAVVDHYEKNTITDWKVTSVYSFLLGEKPEWSKQLNCYAWILRAAGYDVDHLQIYAILRDWKKSDYQKDPERYPEIPFLRKEIDFMPDIQGYVRERVLLHQNAERLMLEGKELVVCTPEERWERPTTYAVAKRSTDRAMRVLDNRLDAEQYMKDKGLVGYQVFERKGSDVRCKDYCAVSPFCDYYKEIYGGV